MKWSRRLGTPGTTPSSLRPTRRARATTPSDPIVSETETERERREGETDRERRTGCTNFRDDTHTCFHQIVFSEVCGAACHAPCSSGACTLVHVHKGASVGSNRGTHVHASLHSHMLTQGKHLKTHRATHTHTHIHTLIYTHVRETRSVRPPSHLALPIIPDSTQSVFGSKFV